jgi:predicted amino acid racemase
MFYPLIEIKEELIIQNSIKVITDLKSKGISTIFVSKLLSGHERLVKKISTLGINGIADSRIENLIKFSNYGVERILLRIPMGDDAMRIVENSESCLISEKETIVLIEEECQRVGKTYGIILMVDLGDLREGIFNEDEFIDTLKYILSLKKVYLKGIGVNLSCFGGVMPSKKNLGRLVELSNIAKSMGYENIMVSGGNSGSLMQFYNVGLNTGINSLRVGSTILMGIGLNDEPMEGYNQNTFRLKAKIIELKTKPSVPIGEIGLDAFGSHPVFLDMGDMKRGILAIGKQDVDITKIHPVDERIKVIGGSSDHTILDLTKCNEDYQLGDIIEFNLEYGAVLNLMTSPYVEKKYI